MVVTILSCVYLNVQYSIFCFFCLHNKELKKIVLEIVQLVKLLTNYLFTVQKQEHSWLQTLH